MNITINDLLEQNNFACGVPERDHEILPTYLIDPLTTVEICQLCRPASTANVPEALPKDFQYTLCENKRPLIGSTVEGSCYVELRTTISTATEAQKWIQKYSTESRTIWRVQCSYQDSGLKNVFKTDFRCQHNTRHKRSESAKRKPSAISKNTQCPAKLTVIVKKVPKRVRTTDKHIPKYPMIIKFKNDHNHSSSCEAALRHRDVNPQVRQKFENLYKEHRHSPGSALVTHIHDLHQELGDEIFEAILDRSRCPERGWCYSLYYKLFNKQYSDKELDSKLDAFVVALEGYSKSLNSECFRFSNLGSGEFSCAIITPLMHRNHQLNSNAGGVCVIDSFVRPEKDKDSISLHLIFCDSDAGGLPLGLIVASSDEDNVLQEACTLYQNMLDSSMHFGKGRDGPQTFLTDDCPGLRDSLAAVFPSAEVLLGVVHLALGVYRVVCSQNCGIPPNQRPHMMQIGKRLLWAKNEDELQAASCEIETGCPELSQQFGRYQEYLREVHSVRKTWSPCLFGNAETARIARGSSLIARDVMLHRLGTYSLLQMAHFIFTRLDSYYRKRLELVATNQELEAIKRRFFVGRSNVGANNINQIATDLFRVVDGPKVYEVDSFIGTCTCPVLNTSSAPCHHQLAVMLHSKQHLFAEKDKIFPQLSIQSRNTLFEIATGKVVSCPDQWCDSNDTKAASNNQPNQIESDFSAACDIIKKAGERNPNLFKEAIIKFSKNVQLMNETQLASSLKEFGVFQLTEKQNKL